MAGTRQVMHQQGVERTTIADIAQAADVPVGNVYYYFKTKDELIDAAVDSSRAGRADTARVARAPSDPAGSPEGARPRAQRPAGPGRRIRVPHGHPVLGARQGRRRRSITTAHSCCASRSTGPRSSSASWDGAMRVTWPSRSWPPIRASPLLTNTLRRPPADGPRGTPARALDRLARLIAPDGSRPPL